MPETDDARLERIAVVSGHYPGSSFESATNHRLYCEAHGYTYVNCNWPTRAVNPYFNKFEFIRHYLDAFDILFWIDDDAFFVDFDVALEGLLPASGAFLSICSSPDFKPLRTEVSSGQFALRSSPVGRRFVDDVLAVDLAAVERWWSPDLGFFTRGDQDALVYLLRTRDEYNRGITIFPYAAFNSRIQNLTGEAPGPVFLVHFTGPPEQKQRDVRRAQRILDRGPGLVPSEAEAGWSIEPPVTPMLWARRRAGRALARLRRIARRIVPQR